MKKYAYADLYIYISSTYMCMFMCVDIHTHISMYR